MTSLVDLTKYVVARIYPALVWGALTGLAVHAGLRSQFDHHSADTEQVSLIETASASVPLRTESARLTLDRDIPDHVAIP